MTHPPFDLVRRPGRIFETLGPEEHWAQGGYEDGHLVDEDSIPVHFMLAECYFVLPRLPRDEPGRYPVLSVARDRRDDAPGIFLHLSYEPSRERFLVAANAGCRSSELQALELPDAPVAHYTGRLLRAFVVVARHGIFPSIDDPYTREQELFGEFALADRFGRQPWGKPPKGIWRIRSGAESELDEEERSFPAGFGLSDLTVTVFHDRSEDFESLPYSGALDHLVNDAWNEAVNPFGADEDWDFGDEESMSAMLLDLSEQLQVLSGGVSTWARRAAGLAEETKHLGLRLLEDGEATTRELEADL